MVQDLIPGDSWFQFTRPRGARHLFRFGFNRTNSFNSRAREGRDGFNAFGFGAGSVSIHAPARGATLAYHYSEGYCEFQFTRPRGARRSSGIVI